MPYVILGTEWLSGEWGKNYNGKIYGTLGPACQDEKILTEMFAAWNDRNEVEFIPCDTGRVRGADREDEVGGRIMRGEAATPDRSSGTGSFAQGRLRSQSC